MLSGICRYMHVYACVSAYVYKYMKLYLYITLLYYRYILYLYVYIQLVCVYVFVCVLRYYFSSFASWKNDGNLWLVQLKQYYLFLGQTEIFFFFVLFLFYICLLCIISFLFQGFYLQRYFSLSLYTCSSFSLIVFFICEVTKEALCPANNLLQTASCLLFLPTL